MAHVTRQEYVTRQQSPIVKTISSGINAREFESQPPSLTSCVTSEKLLVLPMSHCLYLKIRIIIVLINLQNCFTSTVECLDCSLVHRAH